MFRSNNSSTLRKNHTRLTLECLESREVPTTFFLTVKSFGNADDLGDITRLTLRQAINRANNVDPGDNTVINFELGRSQTIQIGNQLPTINRNVTINGTIMIPGVDGDPPTYDKVTVVRIPNSGYFRLFEIANTSTTSISNLKLTGGASDGDGGGIKNGGQLTVSGCILSNNTAGGNGGAIWSSGLNGLTVTDTVVSYNSAYGFGGGIYVGVNSPFTMTGGVVRNNSVTSSGTSEDGGGGGIFLDTFNGLDTTISGVNIYNNGAWYGGGICSKRSIVLDVCTDISDNQAVGAPGVGFGGRGGGVWLGGGGTITYANVSIGNNTAAIGNGVWRGDGTSRVGDGVWWYGDPLNTEWA